MREGRLALLTRGGRSLIQRRGFISLLRRCPMKLTKEKNVLDTMNPRLELKELLCRACFPRIRGWQAQGVAFFLRNLRGLSVEDDGKGCNAGRSLSQAVSDHLEVESLRTLAKRQTQVDPADILVNESAV